MFHVTGVQTFALPISVDIPASKIKVAIAGILVDEGFIEKYDIIEDGCLLYTSLMD